MKIVKKCRKQKRFGLRISFDILNQTSVYKLIDNKTQQEFIVDSPEDAMKLKKELKKK